MSRVPCARCENRVLSDTLHPCPQCFVALCPACEALHQAEKHFKEPERIIHSKSKKHHEEDPDRGSLADA